MKFSPTILFSIALIAFFISPARAHRYHTSLTRMDYNAKEKLVEISIKLFTHDLAPVLEKQAKKPVDLEKTPDVDRLIFDYLNQNFILKNKNGESQKLVWVGKELDVDTVVVYVEIPLEKNFENFSLQNSIFFETFPEQTNLVTARFGETKSDLLFKVGDKFKVIRKAVSGN